MGWLKEIFQLEVNRQSPSTLYGVLSILKDMSRNDGPLDVKVSFNMHKYTPVLMSEDGYDLPKVTTLRGVGNAAFGANMAITSDMGINMRKIPFYSLVMPKVGAYNQEHNGGNGYNAGFPYYGEHTYSGSYIYYGFFKTFYKK